MYEHRTEPLLPKADFYRRVARHGMLALLIITACLLIGMTGYHFFEGEPWIDAYDSAAMILSGMGPISTLRTEGGKVFAGTYALFSGIVFLSTVGVLIAPVAHRMLHRFHLTSGEPPEN